MNLRTVAVTAMQKLAKYDEEMFPPAFRPMVHFVHKVGKLFNDIKSDVMGFVNVSCYISSPTVKQHNGTIGFITTCVNFKLL